MIELSEKTGIKPVVLQEIIQLAQKYEVKKVILFGSRARGDFKERSDCDISKRGEKYAGTSVAKKTGYAIWYQCHSGNDRR